MINKKLEDLTLKEKIGQLVIFGIPSTVYEEDAKLIVEKEKCGNILLFTRNYKNASQLKKLNMDLTNHIYDSCGVVPFIAIDQEGGSVTRLMNDVTFPPSAMSCGATHMKDAAYYSGKMIGRDMMMLGLNLDFAPCFDVNTNLLNFMINTRSFSSNPLTAGAMSKDFIRGLSEYGVLACGKHFPGCDNKTTDAHLELPIVSASKEYMHQTGLVPFKLNIDVPCIMTTHSLFQAYDNVPATLSKNVITGLLRNELNYQGLITTDGLEMKAIADHFGMRKAAVMAIQAGCDFVLVCHDLDIELEVIDELYKAALDGRITIEEIDEHVKRILAYKNKMLSSFEKYFYNDSKYEVSKENNEMAQRIVDESITFVLGSEPVFSKDSLILTPKAVVSCEVEDVFYERNLEKALKREFPSYQIKELNYEEDINVKEYQNIIIFSYDCAFNKKQLDYINHLLSLSDNVYVLSLKGPTDQQFFKNLKNYMVLYEYTPNSIRTIISYMKQQIKPMGKLPNF